MKVTLENDYRNIYTLADLDNARAVIASEKEDTETPQGYLMTAACEAVKDSGICVDRIIEAKAYTAKNIRAWDAYGDTGNMDIWIKGIAETTTGYMDIGAYLTDIWNTGAADYSEHMYRVLYVRA